jgi:hypothetical protein
LSRKGPAGCRAFLRLVQMVLSVLARKEPLALDCGRESSAFYLILKKKPMS